MSCNFDFSLDNQCHLQASLSNLSLESLFQFCATTLVQFNLGRGMADITELNSLIDRSKRSVFRDFNFY